MIKYIAPVSTEYFLYDDKCMMIPHYLPNSTKECVYTLKELSQNDEFIKKSLAVRPGLRKDTLLWADREGQYYFVQLLPVLKLQIERIHNIEWIVYRKSSIRQVES